MDARALIEQLLKAGSTVVDQQAEALRARTAGNPDLAKYAKGAAVGGLLGLLLGTRGGRRMGGAALRLGSVAAVGMLAWKTYEEWQANQRGAKTTSPGAATPSFEALPAPELQRHSNAILKAMIAAAKADGQVDDRESALVEAELVRLQADAALRTWVQDELRRPLDAADVASVSTSPKQAAEIYLASAMVAAIDNPAERAYMDQLAQRLGLAEGLKDALEKQAAAG